MCPLHRARRSELAAGFLFWLNVMEQKYRDWIDKNVTEAMGKCAEVTALMVSQFPELTRVRGHYYCVVWGEREHWWCVATDGSIVDPTASQFPSKGRGHYEPWVEGTPEPTGVCPNCGELVYDGRTCCSDRCHHEYAAYCTNPF
jgi:hypothetical protein